MGFPWLFHALFTAGTGPLVPSPSGASRRVEMACSEFWACKACQAGFAVSIRRGTLALVGDVGFAPKWGIDIVYGDIK